MQVLQAEEAVVEIDAELQLLVADLRELPRLVQGLHAHDQGNGAVADVLNVFEDGFAQGKGVRIRPGDDGPIEEKGFFVEGQYFPSEQAYTQREQAQASGW